MRRCTGQKAQAKKCIRLVQAQRICADSLDFLERLRSDPSSMHARSKGKWLTVRQITSSPTDSLFHLLQA